MKKRVFCLAMMYVLLVSGMSYAKDMGINPPKFHDIRKNISSYPCNVGNVCIPALPKKPKK